MEELENQIDEILKERKKIVDTIHKNLIFVKMLLKKIKTSFYTLQLNHICYKFVFDRGGFDSTVKIELEREIKTKRKIKKSFYDAFEFEYSDCNIYDFAANKLGNFESGKYEGKSFIEYFKPFWVDFEKTKEIIYHDIIQELQLPIIHKRICPNCKNELTDLEARFCSKCGEKL